MGTLTQIQLQVKHGHRHRFYLLFYMLHRVDLDGNQLEDAIDTKETVKQWFNNMELGPMGERETWKVLNMLDMLGITSQPNQPLSQSSNMSIHNFRFP